MKEFILKHHIDKQKEGTYYFIEIDVPSDICELSVAYDYRKKYSGGTNVVDLGLSYPDGSLCGWSGSARKAVKTGAYSATAGYVIGDISEGKWRILVGAYKIAPAGVDVTYTITLNEYRKQWFFGDLHVHTTASDGMLGVTELGKKARKKGLDFVALTNHNNYAENFCLPRVEDLTLLPAVEWTHYKGHVNIYGLKKPFENDFTASDEAEAEKIFDYAEKNGATVSVNHPFCNFCPYTWTLDRFKYVEIWNGPMRGVNMKAVAWWKERLKNGERTVALGGSDYHAKFMPVFLGNPTTALYALSGKAEHLLMAVKRGNCYVTDSVKGVKLECGKESYCFGDTVSSSVGEIEINAFNMPVGSVLKLYDGNETVCVCKSKKGGATVKADAKGRDYLLAEVVKGKRILAIANPVYIEK